MQTARCCCVAGTAAAHHLTPRHQPTALSLNTPPSTPSPPCVDAWFASASPGLVRRALTVYEYSQDGARLLRSEITAADARGDAWWWEAPTAGADAGSGQARGAGVGHVSGAGAASRAPTPAMPVPPRAPQPLQCQRAPPTAPCLPAHRAANSCQPPPSPSLPQSPQIAEIWYHSGAYARALLSLAPAAATGGDAVMEAGVVMP